jgi:16S rRNA (guanine527-N7)-methyltransferase
VDVSRETFLRDQLEILEKGCREWGIGFSQAQGEKFSLYIESLLLWNQRINLISSRDMERLAKRHLLESLAPLKLVPIKEGEEILDLGSGAGLPGLPLKIVRSDLRLSLVESTRKKVLFLRKMVHLLRFSDMEVFWKRGEELVGRQWGLILSRAALRMDDLLPLSFSLLRKGGRLLAFREGGERWGGEELEIGVFQRTLRVSLFTKN